MLHVMLRVVSANVKDRALVGERREQITRAAITVPHHGRRDELVAHQIEATATFPS